MESIRDERVTKRERLLCCHLFLKVFIPAALLACWTGEHAALGGEESPKVLDVSAFGAVPSAINNYEALQAAIRSARAVNGPVELRFEPGAVYRIAPPDGLDPRKAPAFPFALPVERVDHLIIDGRGATLLVTTPEAGGLRTEDCTDVVVKNLDVDYDPFPYAQGTITAINPEEYWFDLKVNEGFPEPDRPFFSRATGKWGLTVRDLSDGGRKYGPTAVVLERWEKIGGRTWRLYPSKSSQGYSNPLASLEVGDCFIHMARTYVQAVAAIKCERIIWENLTVYASSGLAFFPCLCRDITIRDCRVKVGKGRVLSSNADGIHVRSARGPVRIEGCSFAGMADDAINIESSAMSVQEQPAPNEVAVKKQHYSVKPGDRLVMVRSKDAAVLGTSMVSSVADRGTAWLLTMDGDLPELSAGSDFATSDNLYNLSESADPFVIRHCRFGDFRGRGVLLSAHGGLIEDNEFRVREGWGVVMHYESTRWGEGPISCDLTIRSNEFHGYGAPQAAISSGIHTRDGIRVEGRPFHGIRIEGNRFLDYGVPAVDLRDARDAKILDNTVICSDEAPRGRKEYATIELKNCANVTVDGLDVQDHSSRQTAVVEFGADCAQDSMSAVRIDAEVAESCRTVSDKRK